MTPLVSVTSGSRYSTSSVSKPPTDACLVPPCPPSPRCACAGRKSRRPRRPPAHPAQRRVKQYEPAMRSNRRPCRRTADGHERVAGKIVKMTDCSTCRRCARVRHRCDRQIRQHDQKRARIGPANPPWARHSAPASPISRRSVVRWFGVTHVLTSGVTSRRASLASHVLGAGTLIGIDGREFITRKYIRDRKTLLPSLTFS